MLILGLLGNSRFPYYNMTMFGAEGERIISMERFLPMLEYVECGERMVLSFKNKASFDHAIRAWGWVNEDETHSFIMMANHPQCGVDERMPYYILDADYDEENNIAYLYGEQKKLVDVAHTFDLDFGMANMPGEQEPELDTRDMGYGFDIPLDYNYDGPVTSMDNDNYPSFSIECEGCGSTGSFSASGHLVFTLGKPDEVVLKFSPAGFGAYANLALNLHGTLPVSAYYVTNLIPKAPTWGPPGIPGFLDLGLTAAPQFGVALGTFTGGNVTIHTGAGVNLPKTATAELTVSDNPDFTAGSWAPEGYIKAPTAEGNLPNGMSGSVFFQIFAGAKFTLFKIELGAGLTFKPVNLDITVQKEDKCPDTGEPGISVTEKIGSVFGAFVGSFKNEFGVSLPGPGSAKRGIGGAMTWVFWKGIWQEASVCSSVSSKRSIEPGPELRKGAIPHVRRGTGFFDHW